MTTRYRSIPYWYERRAHFRALITTGVFQALSLGIGINTSIQVSQIKGMLPIGPIKATLVIFNPILMTWRSYMYLYLPKLYLSPETWQF